MQLGEAIRSLRSSAGFTQKKFAKLLNISPAYLSLIESNQREPTLPLLRKMAAKLGAPATVLFAAALGNALPSGQRSREKAVIDRLVEATRLALVAERISGHGTD